MAYPGKGALTMMDNLCNFSAVGLDYPAFALCLCQVFHVGLCSAFVRLNPPSLLFTTGRASSMGSAGRSSRESMRFQHSMHFPCSLPAPKLPGNIPKTT